MTDILKADKWLTLGEARDLMLEHPQITGVRVAYCGRRNGKYIEGRNELGVVIMSSRVYDGFEHPKAKKNHVLDWGTT